MARWVCALQHEVSLLVISSTHIFIRQAKSKVKVDTQLIATLQPSLTSYDWLAGRLVSKETEFLCAGIIAIRIRKVLARA